MAGEPAEIGPDDSRDEPGDGAPNNAPTLLERAAGVLADAAEVLGDLGETVSEKAGDIASGGAAIAGDAASAAIAAGKGVYARSGLDAAVDYIGDGLEQKGVFDAIESATEAVGDKFGQITGKRLVEMLEEKLRLQDQYNDVLATRLAEALERIATLEARLNDATR
jgi:hypothetical protein